MSDIKLSRPAASAVVAVEPQKGDNFAIALDPSEAVLSREGSSLVFSFEDGGKVVVDNFYDVYSKDEMPSFNIDDVAVSGEDFFTALNAGDLMPPAGPGQGQSQSAGPGGGHWTDYGNSGILDGIGRLGG
ncbi:MAG: hypothetical protein K6E40_12095, partial [Desulfovibrio sp.]|nr:hypothetical protein [Desulfovibrio sp.]